MWEVLAGRYFQKRKFGLGRAVIEQCFSFWKKLGLNRLNYEPLIIICLAYLIHFSSRLLAVFNSFLARLDTHFIGKNTTPEKSSSSSSLGAIAGRKMLTSRVCKIHKNTGSLNEGELPIFPLWKVLIFFLKCLWSKSCTAWNLFPTTLKIQVKSPFLLGNFGWVAHLLVSPWPNRARTFPFSSTTPCFCLLKYKPLWVWKMQSWMIPFSYMYLQDLSVEGQAMSILAALYRGGEKMWLYPTCCFRSDK